MMNYITTRFEEFSSEMKQTNSSFSFNALQSTLSTVADNDSVSTTKLTNDITKDNKTSSSNVSEKRLAI
jgi:hypothetical protein